MLNVFGLNSNISVLEQLFSYHLFYIYHLCTKSGCPSCSELIHSLKSTSCLSPCLLYIYPINVPIVNAMNICLVIIFHPMCNIKWMLLHSAWISNKWCAEFVHSCSTRPSKWLLLSASYYDHFFNSFFYHHTCVHYAHHSVYRFMQLYITAKNPWLI